MTKAPMFSIAAIALSFSIAASASEEAAKWRLPLDIGGSERSVVHDSEPATRDYSEYFLTEVLRLEGRIVRNAYRFHVQFESGSTSVSSAELESRIANASGSIRSGGFLVVGYTDDSGSLTLNRALANQRAKAVSTWLRENYPDEQIRIESSVFWPGSQSDARRADVFYLRPFVSYD